MMQTKAEKPKRDFMRRLLVPFALALLIILPVGAENWPQWRGPYFNGSTTELGLPTQWSKTEHVVWVAPMPGYSSATPVVWEDCVFASSPDEQKNLLLLCLDRKTGQVRWKKGASGGDFQKGRNNTASPSPVTDGKRFSACSRRAIWRPLILLARSFGSAIWPRTMGVLRSCGFTGRARCSTAASFSCRSCKAIRARTTTATLWRTNGNASPFCCALIRRPARTSGARSVGRTPSVKRRRRIRRQFLTWASGGLRFWWWGPITSRPILRTAGRNCGVAVG